MADDPNTLIDLTLSEDQAMMRDTIRRFVEAELRPASRDADEKGEAPPGLYDKTHALGFAMLAIPEEYGGIGAPRSAVSNVLIAEDLAEGDLSMAIGALSPLSTANAIIDNGTKAQQAKYLPRFVDEKFYPATIALKEPRATFQPKSLETKATKNGSGYALTGKKCLVPLGGSAELLLVVAELEGKPACFIVERGAEGLTAKKEVNMGLRALETSTLTLTNVQVAPDALLGGEEKPFDLQRLVDLGRIGIAALGVGVSQAVLDYVRPYVNERIAFGEPISHRQSVAFMVADIRVELDGMRLLTYKAAGRADHAQIFHREAYLAKLQTAERGMEIGNNGVQLLGGHGYLRDHLVELWYRNLRAISILDGCAVV